MFAKLTCTLLSRVTSFQLIAKLICTICASKYASTCLAAVMSTIIHALCPRTNHEIHGCVKMPTLACGLCECAQITHPGSPGTFIPHQTMCSHFAHRSRHPVQPVTHFVRTRLYGTMNTFLIDHSELTHRDDRSPSSDQTRSFRKQAASCEITHGIPTITCWTKIRMMNNCRLSSQRFETGSALQDHEHITPTRHEPCISLITHTQNIMTVIHVSTHVTIVVDP